MELWEPEKARLYKVVITSEEDKIEEEIGFRQITVNGTSILVNGNPVFMRSVSFHEEIPQRMGRAFSEADASMLLNEAKALGVNMIRLAHYPQNEYTVRMAEKMGIILWQEIPIWQGIDFEDRGTMEKARTMLGEMINRDKNRCAVCFWGVANETKPSDARNAFLLSLLKMGRSMDCSRLYVAAFDLVYFNKNTRHFEMDDPFTSNLDVVAVNKYMGWYHPWPLSPEEAVWDVVPDKPLIISEFGGEALYGQHGDEEVASSWSEEYQAKLYKDNIEMFNHIPNLCGVSPWILFDFRSPFRFHPTNQSGWNRKGLLSDQGLRKKAWYVMHEYYQTEKIREMRLNWNYLAGLFCGLWMLLAGNGYAGNVASPEKVIKVLSVGNSFSQDAVEQYLHELGMEEGYNIVIGNLFIGGCSLERHVNNIRKDASAYDYRKIGLDGKKVHHKNMSISNALAEEEWDYVSLQQASSFSGMYETYETFLPELYGYVKERVGKRSKIVFHQTWAYAKNCRNTGFKKYGNNQIEMYRAIVETVKKAGKLVKFYRVVPSGTAIQNARTSFIGDYMNRDGSHLDIGVGRYTAACTWFEVLTGKSVIGNAFVPENVSDEYRDIAQLAAHEAVRHPDKVTDLSDIKDRSLYKNPAFSIDRRVDDLLARMNLEEKIYQLNQYTLGRNNNENNIGEAVKNIPAEIGSLIYFETTPELRNSVQKKAVEESRLGIPILFGYDVIHGFRTIYPISLGQAASWNPGLVEDACGVAAQEAFTSGVNWTFSPMVDVARDGRWGRVSEGYGEDPYVNGVFAAASVGGYQGDTLSAKNRVAACLKHYVGYGASEAGRDYVPTEISKQTLWDTYLPPFEVGIKAGAATVMSAFNNISGIPASANYYTLTEILKKRWKHRGFVVSDWDAVKQLITQGLAANEKEAAWYAFSAGLEMDMTDNCYQKHLGKLVKEGKVSMEAIDDAVGRILRLKFELGLFENPYTEILPDDRRFLLPSSLNVAEQLAQESMVLLKNDKGVLPLKKGHKIAFIGPMANNRLHLLGSWSAHGDEKDVVSILDGIRKEKGFIKKNILFADGCGFDGNDRRGFAEAIRVAEQADIIIACLGEKKTWSGENASRSVISLPRIQEELLENLKKTGKPLVVLLSSGRPLDLSRIEPLADAMLEIWQPGITAGIAVAGILSGRYNPSGKLPITFPYTTGQIPIYYNHRKSGRTHQGKYQNITSEPLYSFGHGLSYTKFEYGTLKLSSSKIRRGDTLRAEIEVKNVGNYDGKETLLWFVADPFSSITRPVKELKYFEKKEIPAGESRIFTFDINLERDLGFVNEDGKRLLENGIFYIMVKDQKVKIELID